jgi:ABC-type phosphate transport system ATPase subunit
MPTPRGVAATRRSSDDTKNIFTNPKHQLTENYITGRFG